MIYLRGILVGFAFVAPIGMQNIYMFNNALSNKMSKALLYNFLVWFCDALFSFAAFYGIGTLISANEIVKIIVMIIGGALTSYIGFNIIRSAKQTSIGSDQKKQTLKQALMTALIVSWGNPQAMIDGTMMLGASRATLTFEQSILFITGVRQFHLGSRNYDRFQPASRQTSEKVFAGNQSDQRNHRCDLRSVSDFNRYHRNPLECINILYFF